MVGCLLLALSCGGHAEGSGDERPALPAAGPGSPAAAGSAGLADEPAAGGRPPVDTVESPGSAGESPAPEAPEPPCLGSLEELNAIGDVRCPQTWCEASDLAHDCGALSPALAQTSAAECDQPASVWRWWSVDLQLASGEHKVCRYRGGTFLPQGDPELREIEVSNSVPSYCNGASKRISSSDSPPPCTGTSSGLCDGSEPSASTGANATAPTCFTAWGNSCVRCCPAQAPDCSDEAEAEQYTQSDRCAQSTYCMCWCNGGQWQCGC